MNIIFGNYGNGTLALMQWAAEQALNNVHVVSIDTGWAASSWMSHVEHAQTYGRRQGFTVFALKAKASFADLVHQRGSFPSTTFQWCPLLLKGIPFLEWLDVQDPRAVATIYLAKRRNVWTPDLSAVIDSSEHYGQRRVEHPFYLASDSEIEKRVHAAGFKLLAHRSLECDPCIHNQALDFVCLAPEDMHKLEELETAVGQTMFQQPIEAKVAAARAASNSSSILAKMGCADPYHCGD